MSDKVNKWIQLELEPRGEQTSAVQINLALVQRVQQIREHGKLKYIRVRYQDEVLELSGTSVMSFMELWEEYQPLAHADEPAKPGLISVADTADFQFKLNPARR